MWAPLGREETLPLPSYRSRVKRRDSSRQPGVLPAQAARWGAPALLCSLFLLLTFTWVSTSLLVPLWQDSWILWYLASKFSWLSEPHSQETLLPWFWGFQTFLGGSWLEIEASCSQDASSSELSPWRSPGLGVISGAWRTLAPIHLEAICLVKSLFSPPDPKSLPATQHCHSVPTPHKTEYF